MAKRRFIAPTRSEVDPACFAHPLFDDYLEYREWFDAQDWPSLGALNAAMPIADRRFVLQEQSLLDDGLHYETRIGARGIIATRPQNWHDLFNAAVWCRHPALKSAINTRQCEHTATMGPTVRNRAQYALTQFDEAGVVVRVRDPALLALWDRHDWLGLFHRHASAWREGDLRITAVIGHALLEHALVPDLFLVGKCVVVQGDADDAACIARVAAAIAAGHILDDPQALRPLPLAGIPGWHNAQSADFYGSAACFQPLRPGRIYWPPLMLANDFQEYLCDI
jgi:Protein of unknown function (DUF3025)